MNGPTSLRGQTAIAGVATWGCGEMPGHTDMELLVRSAFTRLLLEASQQYEAIVIDTPPVSDFADAQIVCARAGSTVFVTRANGSDARQSQVAVAALKDAGARIAGAAVNG